MISVDLANLLDNQFLYAYFYSFWFQVSFAMLIIYVVSHWTIVLFKKLFFPNR